jgi:hypothetical protein
MALLGVSAFASAPAAVVTLKDAIEPNKRNKIRKSICQKNEALFLS